MEILTVVVLSAVACEKERVARVLEITAAMVVGTIRTNAKGFSRAETTINLADEYLGRNMKSCGCP
jgi:hypothetical protein